MSYTYRGTVFDAVTTMGPKPRPFDPALCGSEQGVGQHRRAGEPGCAKCRAFYNAKRRAARRAA